MRFGICAPFQEVITLRNVPFDYLEENVQRFLIPEQPQTKFEDLWQKARTLPVKIEAANSFFPPDLVLIDTPSQKVDKERLTRYVETALQRAEQVGIQVIVFGSGGARACPADCERTEAIRQVKDHLMEWNEQARNHGVKIVLEPLRYEETNVLNTVAEGGAVVAELGASNIWLLGDIYHMVCNGEAPETILPWASLLSHFHIAENEGRTAPGQHGDNFNAYFSALHKAGYNGRISIECNWGDMPTEVDKAITTLCEQWSASAG